MRFIHMADVHFDSPFSVLSTRENLSNKRRLAQREVFKKAIEYIKEENIPFLFISGDLYEQEYVKTSTIEFINDLFKTIPNTKIFISPGNHDPFLINSPYNTFDWNNNVTIFNNEIKIIELDEVDIYGFGFNDFYCTNSNIENIEIKNKEKINILITHGSLDASKTLELKYNPIKSLKLKNIGFDYVALGHIHKGNYLNNENNLIYPGSLISFGFDELGVHGILDVKINKNNPLKNNLINNNYLNNSEKNKINEINNNKIINNNLINENNLEKNINNLNNLENNLNKNELNNNYFENKNNYKKNNEKNIEISFVKMEEEIFVEKIINSENKNSEEKAIEILNNEKYDDDKLYKIIFEGTKKCDLNPNTICKLVSNKNILKVKDETKIGYDLFKISEQKNLKGMFVKNLLDKIESNPDQKEQIEKAIEIGLEMFE